jgi:hypothetical protein
MHENLAAESAPRGHDGLNKPDAGSEAATDAAQAVTDPVFMNLAHARELRILLSRWQ